MMVKWILNIAHFLLMGFITYIAAGVMEAKTLDTRVKHLERRSANTDSEISDFKKEIIKEIGVIKGQNEIIIYYFKEMNK